MRNLKKIINHAFFVLSCSLLLLAYGGSAHVTDTTMGADPFFHGKAEPASSDPTSRADLCNCKEENRAASPEKRTVKTDIPRAYEKDKEFQYERTVTDEGEGFWNTLLRRILRRLFGKVERKDAENAWKFIYWVLAIIGIALVCYWLYKSEFYGGPLRRSSKINDGSLLTETERTEEDIDEQINDALALNDYPLAIRWTYIKTIKVMALYAQIEIRQDKTNQDYYYEIKDQEKRENFLRLTRLFEYTNYGHFITTLETFQQCAELSRVIITQSRS